MTSSQPVWVDIDANLLHPDLEGSIESLIEGGKAVRLISCCDGVSRRSFDVALYFVFIMGAKGERGRGMRMRVNMNMTSLHAHG
jgi:hypothetical protein